MLVAGGDSYAIRWSRPAANGGTTFTTTTGAPMTFARGQVWVVLAGVPSVITASCRHQGPVLADHRPQPGDHQYRRSLFPVTLAWADRAPCTTNSPK